MKTLNRSNRNEQIFVIKQILFALQIIIICVAIPLLSYLQLTYKTSEPENQSRSSVEIGASKQNSTAAVTKTKAQEHTFVY